MNFLKYTGQYNKWLLFQIIFFVCGLIILFQGFLYDPIGEDLTFTIVLSSTFIAFIFFILSALLIRCPQCGYRFYWHAISKIKQSKWLKWLLELNECPQCKFKDPMSNK
jgi:hypothetical protein